MASKFLPDETIDLRVTYDYYGNPRKVTSRLMGKPTICICETKGADQLRSYCEADQRLCFRYTDSTIPLLSKSKISSLKPSSVLVQVGLCQTCSETTLFDFPRGGSNGIIRRRLFYKISDKYHHVTYL